MSNLLIVVPNLCVGGQQRVAVNMAKILKNDFSVYICTFQSEEQFYLSNCHVLNMNIPASSSGVKKVINVIRRMRMLRRYVQDYKINIVISIGFGAGILNIALAKNIFCMMQEHGYDAINKGLISRLAYWRADVITGCSKGLCDAIKIYMPMVAYKCYHLYNPNMINDIYRQSNKPLKWHAHEGCRYVVSCGRLAEVKNYSRLIKGFCLFHKNHRDWRLLLIGDGQERERLQALAKKLHIDDVVEFVGRQNNPFAFLSQCDLFVLSSYHEGLPNALLEGMCFCPAVAVDCLVGPKEIMSDDIKKKVAEPIVADYGIMVPAARHGYKESVSAVINDDDKSLYKGMCMAVDDERLYDELRVKGKKRVRQFDDIHYRNNILCMLRAFY